MSRVLGALFALLLAGALVWASPVAARHYPFMTVTFVRHAQSEADAAGIVDTALPGAPLTAEGRAQAKQAAEDIGSSFPDAVFSSPAPSAEQTAQYLADQTGRPVQVLAGLDELDERFGGALQTMWDGGYSNPVAYTHAAAIWAWTMANVDRPPTDISPELPDTGYVVVRGSPENGWVLVDWNGRPFS